MIRAEHVTKFYGDFKAVDSIDASLKDGSIFGLVGTNGAGKSTFLRMAAGIMKPDDGSIMVDGEDVFENPEVKQRIFYISDEQYFFANTTPFELMGFYQNFYPKFDCKRYFKLLDNFGLDRSRKVNTYSKGMKKQLSILLGICSNTDYIICDETFDGLDPVMRQAVKSMFAEAVSERNLTPVIASHNLRELEDICDHIGLLHKGGILFERDLDDMKLSVQKIQCAFSEDKTRDDFLGMDIMTWQKHGSVIMMVVRGKSEELAQRIGEMEPLFLDILPLTLEEIFITETEVLGYDIKKIIS